ncbi:hypothetical protein EDB85DRAFT_2141181 [Lactarius pseudohatsudake]|nr:hypothetical protein EDB85DRAFT_2141181 [Lactarius pseudohatsudake]
MPPPRAHPPKVSTPVQAPKPTPSTPSYASAARKPVRPSLIVSKKLTPEAMQPLASARHGCPEVSLSAARWTKNNNLVVVAGPDTTAHQLNSSSHFISNTLSTFLSHTPSDPLPVSAKENVRWSCLLINNLPTRVTATCGAYSPQECQDTLTCDNPVYRSLLVVTFEDPTGATLQELLGHGSLFAFGHQGHLKHWKQRPRAKAPAPPSDMPPVHV